jgi:phosphotransferase system, enzyme I, PtsP
MPYSEAVDSRVLLTRLRAVLAEPGGGQERLDRIVRLVAEGLVAEVCSVYLRREDWLELSSTEGLNPGSVHLSRLRVGQGLVGQIADTAEPINTRDAPHTRGFRYLPETGEEVFSSFLGVPVQRLGEVLGVLVVQNREPREYNDDEVYALEVVAMVIAEMAELGAFVGPGAMEIGRPHRLPFFARGLVGQEGVAEGTVVLHEPHIVISDPISDDPERERRRLHSGVEALRAEVDEMLAADYLTATGEHRDVLNAYRMFAYDKGWVRRMEASIDSGLAAEVAVEKEQSATRARPTHTCASGCTISTISRTAWCGCSPAASNTTAASCPTTPSSSPATSDRASSSTTAGGCAASCSRRARSAATPRSSPGRWRSRW